MKLDCIGDIYDLKGERLEEGYLVATTTTDEYVLCRVVGWEIDEDATDAEEYCGRVVVETELGRSEMTFPLFLSGSGGAYCQDIWADARVARKFIISTPEGNIWEGDRVSVEWGKERIQGTAVLRLRTSDYPSISRLMIARDDGVKSGSGPNGEWTLDDQAVNTAIILSKDR